MKRLRLTATMAAFTLVGAAFAFAQDLTGTEAFDIVIVGETHDNPAHHRNQAKVIAHLEPRAVVLEMLTPEQASAYSPDADADTLARAFEWDASGWPDFAIYAPIFDAVRGARVYGAGVPRDAAMAVMQSSLADAFGSQAVDFGLTASLPQDEQTQRETFQAAVHCDALPSELLATMVDIQRLRDATLAQTALTALSDTGGPVVVITGNGHARTDWGMPVYVAYAAPEVSMLSIGQRENDVDPAGTFDLLWDAPGVTGRGDPCDAFR